MTENENKLNQNRQFWDIKKSGERLLWRISPNENGEYKPFKPNESDFNALKSILGTINRFEGKVLYNNKLFAKLYLMQLVGDIRENNTSIFNEMIFTNLSSQLAKPLDLFYLAFYEDLCANQLYKLSEKNVEDIDMREFILDQKRFKETFSIEYVTSKLNEMMNKTLHRRS